MKKGEILEKLYHLRKLTGSRLDHLIAAMETEEPSESGGTYTNCTVCTARDDRVALLMADRYALRTLVAEQRQTLQGIEQLLHCWNQPDAPAQAIKTQIEKLIHDHAAMESVPDIGEDTDPSRCWGVLLLSDLEKALQMVVSHVDGVTNVVSNTEQDRRYALQSTLTGIEKSLIAIQQYLLDREKHTS